MHGESICHDRLRRSLSSASLHINRNELQQLYNSLPKLQTKNYQLPTISSKNKVAGNDPEKGAVQCDHQKRNNKQMTDLDDIR